MKTDRVLQLARLAKQLELERAEAKPTIERFLNKAALDRQWDVPVPRVWRTLGFVQELTAACVVVMGKDLVHAESLARFAIVVAGNIHAGQYPELARNSAEAEAWKELANARRLQSKYEAALRALDEADRCLTLPAQSYDRTVVKFARALVLSDQQLFADASDLLLEAKEEFSRFEDTARLGQCLLLEGMNEYRQGRPREASATYRRAIDSLRNTDDLHTLAAVYSNLAYALIDIGDLDSASSSLHDACAIFNHLGLRPSVARARAALGKILLATQKYELARNMLSEVRLIFLGLHMPEEAGIVGLYLAEAWLGLGKTAKAQTIVEDVVQEFAHAGLIERCQIAFNWLNEKIPTAYALTAVRHVTSYVEQVRREPQRVFVPLLEQ